jgi:2'-5' RNA ligase
VLRREDGTRERTVPGSITTVALVSTLPCPASASLSWSSLARYRHFGRPRVARQLPREQRESTIRFAPAVSAGRPVKTLYTVAFPELSAPDREFIEQFRSQHDPRQRDLIPAHFTLVFGTDAVAEPDFTRHVAEVATRTDAIEFCCRYALLSPDAESPTATIFLVPDEGFSAISRLHDELYTGALASQLRLDIQYTPHITIGSQLSRDVAMSLCNELNRQNIEVRGSLRALTVGSVDNGKFVNHASVPLRPRIER